MSCSGNCQSSLTESDVKNITDSIAVLMDNPEGRQRFVTFLETRNFPDYLEALEFVEGCEGVIELVESAKLNKEEVSELKLRRALIRVVEMAEYNDGVNMYGSELNKLKQVLEERDHDEICETLRWARALGLNLLESPHKMFSKILIKEYFSRPSCN